MDSNGQLIRALSRLVTACELEQQGLTESKAALLQAIEFGRAVLQEVVQGAKPDGATACSYCRGVHGDLEACRTPAAAEV